MATPDSLSGRRSTAGLREIVQLVEDDLARVEAFFEEQCRSDVRLVGEIARYISQGGGKRIRPALLLLACRLVGYRGERAVLLASVDLFVDRDCPVPAQARRRLLERLDLYGVALAMSHLAAAPRSSTGELVRALAQASGFPRLRQTLDHTFRWRSDAIKAGSAVAGLERVADTGEPADRELLRGVIEDLVRLPEYHRLRLLDAAQVVSTGEVPLPPVLEQELTRLALSNDAAFILGLPGVDAPELGAAARAAALRWRAFAVADATPAQSRVALVAHRGFQLLAQSLLPAAPSGAAPSNAAPTWVAP